MACKKTSISLPERTRGRLRVEAKQQDRSVSWLVNRILSEWFAATEKARKATNGNPGRRFS